MKRFLKGVITLPSEGLMVLSIIVGIVLILASVVLEAVAMVFGDGGVANLERLDEWKSR